MLSFRQFVVESAADVQYRLYKNMKAHDTHKTYPYVVFAYDSKLTTETDIGYETDPEEDFGIKEIPYYQTVGFLRVSKNENGKFFAAKVGVLRAYRLKGIAGHMYDVVEKVIGQKMIPSTEQSPDGKEFWKHRPINESSSYDLSSKFQHFNKLVFYGTMPECQLSWAKLDGEAGETTWQHRAGKVVPGTIQIKISDKFKREDRALDQSLVHEMIHAYLAAEFDHPPVHDAMFHGFLKRAEGILHFPIPDTETVRPDGSLIV